MLLLHQVKSPLFVNLVKISILYLFTEYLNNISPHLSFKLHEGKDAVQLYLTLYH